MSYQVLARKWRPKSFAALVGQEHVVRALSHALDQRRLHHAYLFTGTRGVGKTTLARIVAKALNCQAGISSTPCGVCAACTEIDAGRFIDLLELDAASNTGIDNMREVLDNAQYAPTAGRFKVYLIDEVHMLSKPAFNSMLKTLEEPPEHLMFILATTDPQKIPVTVLSRCLQFNLKAMPLAQIVEHLARVLEAEGVAFEPGALRHLATAAAGSMRDALSLVDQAIAHGAGKVEDEAVRAMLGTVGDEHLFALLDGLLAEDVAAMLEVAKLMDARSLSFDGGLQELATLFHRIALAQFAPQALLDEAERSRLAPYAQALDAEYLQLAYQIAIHGREELSLAPDDYAGFVMTLLRLHAFRPEPAGGRSTTPQAGPVAVRAAVPAAPTAPAPSAQPRRPAGGAAPAPTLPPAGPATAEIARPEPSPDPAGNPAPGAAPAELDWHALVARLPLTGMAKQLAQHCELSERSASAIRLRLSPVHRHLLGKPQQEKLHAELQAWHGDVLRLAIDVAEPATETPAARRKSVQRERQERAIASIEQDPFVRDVVDLFDASIDESTIKPV